MYGETFHGRHTAQHQLQIKLRNEILAFDKYCKIPKYWDTHKISVIIRKFEQCGSTIED